MKKIVSTDKAPGAIGPYSQAVWAGDTLYCSGQLGLDSATGALALGGITEQCAQALKNVVAILNSQGLTAANVVKTLVFLNDMGDFGAFNAEYSKVFPSEPPARSCVAVSALPLHALVEIEVIARK
jgi:2-iminobutanoate/2-iminopropanoate deaminase